MDIREVQLESLRRHIGIVQQDVFLFSGTIKENIAYGDLTATDEQIWDAARRASLEELILSLPEGINTVIGERGVKLSGGQKQRLSIARMFLKNPPILILDEATSALDTETEALIQKSLAELSVGRTTLVIAHRLTTIKNADRILVVNADGIAEQGNHEELVAAGGYTAGFTRFNIAIPDSRKTNRAFARFVFLFFNKVTLIQTIRFINIILLTTSTKRIIIMLTMSTKREGLTSTLSK